MKTAIESITGKKSKKIFDIYYFTDHTNWYITVSQNLISIFIWIDEGDGYGQYYMVYFLGTKKSLIAQLTNIV